MKRILIAIIKAYKKYISPYKRVKCPYYPSCSDYGLEAVEKHGAFAGSFLALRRIIKCNPFSKGGIDYVPEKISFSDIYLSRRFGGNC